MKKTLLKVLLLVLVLGVVVVGAGVVYLDRDAWRCSRKLSTALQGARAVSLIEYVPGKVIVQKTATPDEISGLRNAASKWVRPFRPDTSMCWEPHHNIEIIRADGSEVTIEICFLCGKFGFLSDDEPVVPIPPSLQRSLTLFFTSVGMSPKTHEEYLAMEILTKDAHAEQEGR